MKRYDCLVLLRLQSMLSSLAHSFTSWVFDYCGKAMNKTFTNK
jgi:hypothetical protein